MPEERYALLNKTAIAFSPRKLPFCLFIFTKYLAALSTFPTEANAVAILVKSNGLFLNELNALVSFPILLNDIR